MQGSRSVADAFLCCIVAAALIHPSELAAESKGEVRVSGPMTVELTYDKAAVEPEETAPSQGGAAKVECSGGGLMGAVDCVTQHIGAAGSASGSQEGTRERGSSGAETEGRPAIHVTMTGTVTPVVIERDDGTYLLQVKDAISMPRFSPGTPGDIRKRASRDEAAIKLGLRRWSMTLTADQLQDEPEQVADFSGPFSSLSLFTTVRAPQPQSFNVYWRSGHCDELEREFVQAQSDYIAHVSAMPVLDQIDLVTGTMDEIETALKLTAEGTAGVADDVSNVTELTSVNKKLDELMEETGGLSSALSNALEGVKTSLGEEHQRLMQASGIGEPLSQVKEGLEKNAEMMEEVASAISDMNGTAKELGRLVKAADGDASEQLRMFQDYFGAVHERLGPLVDAIPGLGVFLNLYGEAIGQIADSAERIENIVNERNRQAREAGIPEPYVKARTARERAEAERVRLEQRMNELADRVGAECPGFDLSGQEYGEIQAIEDAKHRAREACEDTRMNLTNASRIRTEYREADRNFSGINLTEAENSYADRLASYKELRNLYDKVKRNSVRSNDDRFRVRDYLKSYYQNERRISEYNRNENRYLVGNYTNDDISALGDHSAYKKRELRGAMQTRDAERARKDRYDRAKAASDALSSDNEKYRDCVGNFIRGLARDKGWDMRLVEVLNSGYM